MNRISQPSPAIVVAVLALVAALTGVAIAQPAAKKVTTKKVKKIANKQINKLAPGLSVAHAESANTATTASSADSADALSTQRKLNYEASAVSPSQQILSLGNLRLRADCAAGPALTLAAETTVDNATINSYGNHVVVEDDDWDTGEVTVLSVDDEERDVVYTAPGGQVIVLQYGADEGSLYGDSAGCIVKGIAQIL